MSLQMFAQDLKAKEDGIWETLGEMKFKIAHANNTRWKEKYEKLRQQEYKGRQRKPKFEGDPKKDVKIMFECLAATCIVDWENVTLVPGGKSIPFSLAKSVEILTDEKYQILTEKLLEIAVDQDRFMEEQIIADEEVAGK